MKRFLLFVAALGVASAMGGCSSGAAATATAPSQTIATDVVTGTIPAPVNGVLQSDFKVFTVGQGGGPISVGLTSAIETLPNGTLLTNVQMILSVGQPTGTTCTPLANATVVGPPGTAPLAGTVAAGTYCTLVADGTGQLGPVAYAVSISHP